MLMRCRHSQAQKRWIHFLRTSIPKQGFSKDHESKLSRSTSPNTSSQFVAALKQCSKTRDLDSGKKLHRLAVEAGLHTDKYVCNVLISMYSKCRNMAFAQQVFDGMTFRDVITWNALILGYVENGNSSIAMDLFAAMDCDPSSVTYLAALKACRCLASEKQSQKQVYLSKGIDIHKQVRDRGFDSDAAVATTLVDMYCKCGSMKRAREVFDAMTQPSVVTWTCLIAGYVENGESVVAMDLFSGMNCEPNNFTFVAALKACASLIQSSQSNQSEKLFYLDKGMMIHKQVRDRGFDSDVVLGTTLVDLYCKCGSMDHAKEVFDRMVRKDVVAWNALILGYVENGQSSVAMELFNRMDCKPSSFTFVAALKACAGLASETDSDRANSEKNKQLCLDKGASIHRQVRERGLDINMFVGTSLLDMYSKCGSMDRAKEVFDKMVLKDVVAWNSLVMGYVENGQGRAAMDLLSRMDCEPNTVTYVAGLKACGNLAALPAGLQIHAKISQSGLEQDRVIANTLMDFYVRCGSMSRAEELFNNMHSPDVVSWTTLIAGYSSFGDSSRVFDLMKKMQLVDLQMNAVTFTCILTACSHAGLVDVGKLFFDSMPISPNVEHYNCMVDMLGRANRLQEALALVNGMPFEADAVTWKTLLGACKKWKNVQVGKIAFDALVAANTKDGAAYVLMSDLYGEQMVAEREAVSKPGEIDSEGRAGDKIGKERQILVGDAEYKDPECGPH